MRKKILAFILVCLVVARRLDFASPGLAATIAWIVVGAFACVVGALVLARILVRVPRWVGVCLCALVLILGAKSVPHRQESKLNLYIWSAYLAPDTLPEFEKRHGVKVSFDTYDSNEAILAKLQAGNVDYDLVVPSDYMVEILIRENLLAELDKGALKNLRNIDPAFLDKPYDPGNRYSVPYFWGTTGFGYRKDKVPGVIDSWKVLWDPKYRDRITMLDDMRENFSAALHSLGYSSNTTSTAEIQQAKELLMKQKPLLKSYNSGNFHEMLLSGDAWLVQGFNGQVAKAMKENPNIGYCLPKEGCTISFDNLCIPRNAPHRELALLFMDYVMEAEVAAKLVNACYYSTPNRECVPQVSAHIRENSAIFPARENLAHTELIHDVGRAVEAYDAAWTEIKSR